jgi:hypothetical protein
MGSVCGIYLQLCTCLITYATVISTVMTKHYKFALQYLCLVWMNVQSFV